MAADEDKIRHLLEASSQRRLDTAIEAGQTAQTLASLQQQLTNTEASYSKAWKAAVDAGWTEKELRQIGLTKPGSRGRRNAAGDQQPSREPDHP